MVALGVPVSVHLAVVGAAVAVSVPFAVRAFMPDREEADGRAPGTRFGAWKEPRTLLVGVFVLAFAFAEGAGNDWIAVALIEDYGAHADAIGTLALAAFLTAMTARALDRAGAARALRARARPCARSRWSPSPGSPCSASGRTCELAIAGVMLWGAGLALGFPVGMSAGADDPALAASRVSVVSSIGYCAFLAGPPLIGFLGEHSTVLRALTAVIVLLGLAALIAGAVRPLSTSSSPRRGHRSRPPR